LKIKKVLEVEKKEPKGGKNVVEEESKDGSCRLGSGREKKMKRENVE
jgi:hypothetical protein